MISPMSPERIGGIARYAKEHGWNLLIQDRLGHTPVAWHGDGVLATLRSDPVSFKSIETLMRRGIPVVDLTISRPDIDVPRVTSDHEAIGRLAAEHFREREFRHVAWFSTAWGNVHKLRHQGLSDAWGSEVPCWVPGMNVPNNEWTGFLAWLSTHLAASPKPLAVLTYDETDAARLLYAARELGIAVPEELAILSIGNNPLICENQSIPLSSIDQDLERGGYEAAKLLDNLMTTTTPQSSIVNRQSPITTPQSPIVNRQSLLLISPTGVVTRRSTDVIAVNNPTIRAALEYIADHLHEPIGAPQIAAALSLNRANLDKHFRTTLNRSIGEEIRRQRLVKAKRLLRETNKPISAIAAKTGYCTPSHLTNAFRATFGLTPKEWRTQA